MPQTYYGINGFSADSAAGCEYYTIGRRGEQDGFYLSPLGHTDERCMLTPGAGFTLPPEQLSGEYTISTCPAVVSCDGSLPQQEALDVLTEKYLDFLTGEDTNRSFTVLEYRGVTSMSSFSAYAESPESSSALFSVLRRSPEVVPKREAYLPRRAFRERQ